MMCILFIIGRRQARVHCNQWRVIYLIAIGIASWCVILKKLMCCWKNISSCIIEEIISPCIWKTFDKDDVYCNAYDIMISWFSPISLLCPASYNSQSFYNYKNLQPYDWLPRFSLSGWPYRHVRYKVILLATSLVTPHPCCHWTYCLVVLQTTHH